MSERRAARIPSLYNAPQITRLVLEEILRGVLRLEHFETLRKQYQTAASDEDGNGRIVQWIQKLMREALHRRAAERSRVTCSHDQSGEDQRKHAAGSGGETLESLLTMIAHSLEQVRLLPARGARDTEGSATPLDRSR